MKNTLLCGLKDKRYFFITVVLIYFFLWAVVFPIPVYAASEIVAWGLNWAGECNVPSPNTGFTAIAAGESHSLALWQTVPGSIPCMAPSWCGGADINKDGRVDFEDIAIIANHWLEGN